MAAEVCFQFEFFAATADVAAMRAVGHYGHAVVLHVTTGFFLATVRVEIAIAESGWDFQTAVFFPVLPTEVT